MIIVPVYQTYIYNNYNNNNRFWILASILSGSIYFQEINNFNKTQWVMFPIAIVITLIGLWILSACKTTKPAKPTSDLPSTLKSERKLSLTDAVGETIEMGIRVNDNPETAGNGDNSISKLHGNTSYKNDTNNTTGRKSHLSDVNYQPPPALIIPAASTKSLKSSPRKKSLSSRSPTKPNSIMNKTPESIKPKTSQEELAVDQINIDIPPTDQM